MSDTQWPRFEVFKQDRPDKPHESIGTVHAADAEMALQNARDVFARRPQCHNLWVAPAEAIFAKTAAEIEQDDTWRDEPIDPDAPTEIYLVFQKQTERRGMQFVTHVGDVEATSAVHAMSVALETFTESDPFVWWVCPQRAITSSESDSIDSLFEPAQDKIYRLPNQYRTVFSMQKIQRADKERD